MKKQNKQKGFTLVELVIVIAVIAILAGVLIPTFSGIVEKANKSARLQEAENALKVALISQEDGALDDVTVIIIDSKYKYEYKNGKLNDESEITTENSFDKGELVEVTQGGTGDKNGYTGSKTTDEGEASTTTEAKGVITDLSSKVKIYMSDSDARQIK